jgi:hypothetical protein
MTREMEGVEAGAGSGAGAGQRRTGFPLVKEMTGFWVIRFLSRSFDRPTLSAPPSAGHRPQEGGSGMALRAGWNQCASHLSQKPRHSRERENPGRTLRRIAPHPLNTPTPSGRGGGVGGEGNHLSEVTPRNPDSPLRTRNPDSPLGPRTPELSPFPRTPLRTHTSP